MSQLSKLVLLLWIVMWGVIGVRLLFIVGGEGPLPALSVLFGLGILAAGTGELLTIGTGNALRRASWKGFRKAAEQCRKLLPAASTSNRTR